MPITAQIKQLLQIKEFELALHLAVRIVLLLLRYLTISNDILS